MEQNLTPAQRAKTPKEVTDSVKIYLRRLGTIKEAAEGLGVAPNTLSTQLAGNGYLSQRIAGRLERKYGFDIDFLTTGVGALFKDKSANDGEPLILPDVNKIFASNKDRGKPADEGAPQGVAIMTAVSVMCEQLDRIKGEYLNAVESVRFMIGMIPDGTPEAQAAAKIAQALNTISIPDLHNYNL